MNPEKKRKADDEDMERKLFEISAERGYNAIMATDCTDKLKIKRVFDKMEYFAIGLLRQQFVQKEIDFNRDKEEFEMKVRENEKVKRVLASFEEVSPPPPSSTSTSSNSSSSSSSGGGGGGILGMLTGTRK